jgi:Cys-tRNA(Pro)/Cys-tRNA(Cys) deacylase
VAHQVHEYVVGDDATDGYGLVAARALGVDSARVLKTLVALVDGRPCVAVVPVAGRLSLKSLAAAAGGKRAEMAAAADAERVTGYVVGGISPFGRRRRSLTVVDDGAVAHATVFVSGGRRGLQLELAPADLIDALDAVVAPIAAAGRLL